MNKFPRWEYEKNDVIKLIKNLNLLSGEEEVEEQSTVHYEEMKDMQQGNAPQEKKHEENKLD